MAAVLPTYLTLFGGSYFGITSGTASSVVRVNAAGNAFEQVTIYSRSEADASFAALGSLASYGLLSGGNSWYGTQSFLNSSDATTASINSQTGVISGVGGYFVGTFSNSSGTSTAFHINPTDSTTGTGGLDILKVTRSGSGTGSGAKNLLRLVDGTTNRLTVTSSGTLTGTTFVATGQSAPSSGTGLEFFYDSALSLGKIDAYDRTSSAYKAVAIDGTTVRLCSISGGRALVGTTTDDGANRLQVSGSVSVFGSNPIRFNANSSTSTNREQSNFTPSFVVSTDASRTSRVVWNVFDTAAREAMRVEASGSASMLGFYGSAAVAKQTITGVRSDGTALADLLTKLATLGLITDSTTA